MVLQLKRFLLLCVLSSVGIPSTNVSLHAAVDDLASVKSDQRKLANEINEYMLKMIKATRVAGDHEFVANGRKFKVTTEIGADGEPRYYGTHDPIESFITRLKLIAESVPMSEIDKVEHRHYLRHAARALSAAKTAFPSLIEASNLLAPYLK